MSYTPKSYDRLLGTAGFSDTLLKNHFTLYQGYVTNTNKLLEVISTLAKEGKSSTPEYAEVTRRFGWEFNGMRLHEFYFENMSKETNPLDKSSRFAGTIAKKYGSYENWEKDFKAVGALRGIGWAVTYADPENGEVYNCWINEHDEGHLAGAAPILVMDVFEHAFMTDYGLKRADYITAFFKAVDWKVISRRYDAVIKARAAGGISLAA